MSDTHSERPDDKKRLGLTFHRTFSLMRSAVSQIIRAADEVELSGKEKLDLKTIKELSSLGSIYIEAMPRYARGSGLLNQKNFLTKFGKYAVKYDPLLDQSGTQWLMHYHLSAPQGPGALFWSELISKRFYPGSVFTADEIVDQIGNFIWEIENKPPSERAVRSTATILLGTYIKLECLGKLQLLELMDSGRYRVCEPTPAPVWAVGYALIDFWEAFYAGRVGIGFDILQGSEFPKLFMMGKSELDDVLQALQEIRYVEVHKTAPPHQVLLLRQDRDTLLKKLYGAD